MKAFFKKFSLHNNLQAFQETMVRFPLSSICAILCFGIVIYGLHYDDFMRQENTGRLILSFIVGYFWFGLVQIFAESKNLKGIKQAALSIIGFAPLLFITFGETTEFFRLFFIIPAILLAIMGAPYIFNKSDNQSFWVYNRDVWYGVAISYVASMLLAGGIAAGIYAIKTLFDVKINDNIYGDLFAFCGIILGPIYALFFVPKKFIVSAGECHTPTQVGFIINWILAPLVIAYMAILYAYFIKIGLTWEIPKGQLSYMVAGFLGAGLITYMISWPMHEQGGKALRLISKYLFAAMILPIIMQAISIGMRINQYGFTEQRYVVAMSVLWFAFIAIGFLTHKLQMKHIPLSLALSLIIAGWGPWSARDVSKLSQMARLETALEQAGFLKDGKLIKGDNSSSLSFQSRKNISSISDYVFGHQHKFHGYKDRYEMFKDLNIEYVLPYNLDEQIIDLENGKFNFYFNNKEFDKAVDVRNTDYYLNNVYIYKDGKDNKRPLNKDNYINFSNMNENNVVVNINDANPITIHLQEKLDYLITERNKGLATQEPVIVEGKNNAFSVRLEILSMNGEIKDKKADISNITAAVFVDIR